MQAYVHRTNYLNHNQLVHSTHPILALQ